MKTVVRDCEVWIGSMNLSIKVTEKSGCYLEMLEAFKQQLDNLLTHYSRILVIRFDLHQHDYSSDSKHISRFFEKLKKQLGKKHKLHNIGHIWVREIEKAKQQHYHCALMINAHKVNYPDSIIRRIESIWVGRGQPKPYTPKSCYSIIARGDQTSYRTEFERLSYFAKERGKGYRPASANDYSTSRIQPNKDRGYFRAERAIAVMDYRSK